MISKLLVPGLESNTKSTQPPPRTSIRVLAKQISQENNQLTNRGVKRKSRGKSLESVNLPSRKRLKNTSASKDDKDEALEPGSQETSAPNDKPRFSDQKGDYIVFICSICSFEGHYRKLLAHLKKQHSLNITEYKKIYGKSETKEKILHKCKICHDSIEFIYDTLTSHFRSKHDGFNIKKYVACFLDGDDPKGENLESSQQTISASGNFSSVRAHHKMIHQGDHQLEDSAEKSVELGNIDVNPVEQSQEALNQKIFRGNEEHEGSAGVMVVNDTSNKDQAGKKTFLEQNRGQISTQKSKGGSGSCSFAAFAEEDGITTKTNGAADVSHPETFIAANSMAKAGPDNPEVRPVKRRKSVGRSTRGRPLPRSKPAAVTNERNWM